MENGTDSANSGLEMLLGTESAKPAYADEKSRNSLLRWFTATLGFFTLTPLYFFLSIFAVFPFFFLIIYALLTLFGGVWNTWSPIRRYAITPFIIFPLFVIGSLVFVFVSIPFGYEVYGYTKKTRLISAGIYLRKYASEHDGSWPDAKRWCDQLIDETDLKEDLLLTESRSKDSRYAMNIYAQPLGVDMPKDMVLLFESRPGWNVTGGQEWVVEKSSPNDRIGVLFGDMKVKFIRKKNIPFLRWQLEGNPVKPEVHKAYLYVLISSVFAAVCLGGIVRNRRFIRSYRQPIFYLMILAGGLGALLGGMAFMLYPYEEQQPLFIWFIGAGTGILMAAAYLPTAVKRAQRIDDLRFIVPDAVTLGCVAGILCSSVIHGFLMVYYEEPSPVPLISGAAYGIYAGAILGWIAGLMIKRKRKQTEGVLEISQ